MKVPVQDSKSIAPGGLSRHWWDSLAFRLAVVINITAIVVLGGFWFLDYRIETSTSIKAQADRLREEARVLRATHERFRENVDFQRFVDAFCRQMDMSTSPGHHIVILGPDGKVSIRAHERANPDLEARMIAGRAARSYRFPHAHREYLGVAVPDVDGGQVLIAQSLEPIERAVHARVLRRAASLGVLALLVFVVTTLALLRWVRQPLRTLVNGIRAIGHGQFDSHVAPSGTPELRYLANGVNEMARALDRVERNRQASMRHAREIQQRLLPQGTYMGREVQVVSVFEPADSVGGDFHDVIELPDGSLILAILDVSGHGVPAALYTALLRTVLRHQIAAGADLNAVLRTMNEEFNAVAGGSGDFATCCLLKLDPRAGALSYLNAGHEPPIIVGSTGVTLLDQEHGPPVGVGDLAPASVCQASLEPGERLFLYSDGLHEVFDDHNKQFGRERLTQALVDTSRQPPDAQLKAVLERVRSFARQGRLTDDVTLLCAQRRTGADRHGP